MPAIQTTTSITTTIPPTTSQPRFYEIQSGDTLIEIAAAFGLPVQAVMEANGITDANVIFAGQIITLPLAVGDRGHVPATDHHVAAGHRPPCRHGAHSVDSPGVTSFWPTSDHWSVKIPLDTAHPRLDQLAERGWVALRDADFDVPESEYLALHYQDWKSGGDTNFAPIASADGELDCRGFWDKGKTDKDALWTSNADVVPSIRRYVDDVGANFGRVRVIKLEPQSRDDALRSVHRDDNNRFNPEGEGWVVRSWLELTDNPDSYMLLMDSGPDGLPDPATEARMPLHRGARFVVDTQRLWHVVVHPGDAPRYALITSFESGPALSAWIDAERVPVAV